MTAECPYTWQSQNFPFHGGSGLPSNTWFLWPIWVLNPNGISVGAAVFAGLTSVTDRQTDRPRCSVGNNRPHLHRKSIKGATITMAITLSIPDRFAEFFHCCKEHWDHCEDMWGRYCCLTRFFPTVDTCLSREDSLTKLCDGEQMANLWRFFASCISSEPRAARFRPAF